MEKDHSLRFYCFLRIGTYVTTVWHVHKKACCWSRDTRRGRIRPLLSSSAPFLSFSLKNNNIYLYREEGKELFNFNRCCKAPIKYCINIVIRFFVTSELLRIRLLKTEVDDSYVKVWYKVLPLFSWKRLDLHLAWMTTKNGGPVSRFFKVFLSHLKQRFVCNPAHWSKWFQPF